MKQSTYLCVMEHNAITTKSAIRVKQPLTISEAELSVMTLEQLRDIYGATSGIVYQSDTREQLLAVLIRGINNLKQWV